MGFEWGTCNGHESISLDEPTAISWKKTVVDKKFRSEGVAIADVNKDGKMDILCGDIIIMQFKERSAF